MSIVPACSARVARAAFAAAVGLLVVACATPEGGQAPATTARPGTAPAAPAPTTTPPSTAAPAVATPAPAPELPPSEARPLAAKLALQAVDQLQVGDEAAARTTLNEALRHDPANDLAKKLLDQINADAQRELGAPVWRYTVQPGDSLSRIAQTYMGDRFRFWILAKYNDITNPSRLSAGQVVKVPGRQPPPSATAPAPAAAPEAPPPVAAPEPKADFAEAMKKGAELEKAGNLEGALVAYTDAAARNPGNAEAAKKRDATRATLIRTLDREASQAFQRQNLDLAITKWDRVLELDPANRKARLERERALDLKKRMADKFGGAAKK
jgi:tetratricopeptide (TPR) repeat protein